jgi:hypothetical protein
MTDYPGISQAEFPDEQYAAYPAWPATPEVPLDNFLPGAAS